MEPFTSIILLYTITLIGSVIGVAIVTTHIADNIEQTIFKYRPNTQ